LIRDLVSHKENGEKRRLKPIKFGEGIQQGNKGTHRFPNNFSIEAKVSKERIEESELR